MTFQSVSTEGYCHACGLTPTGGAYCWGSNPEGELGDGTTSDR
jgi:alpha-tubulin suppressor-like RCC1 family protein